LCRLAGLQESAVICEIMKDDGEMARRKDLLEFAEKYNLRVVYISDIVEYRLQNERLISLMEQNEIEMFGVRVKRYLFKDHLNRLHTAIQFYSKHSIANVKFHHVGLDVDLLTNSKKYSSLVRSIEYLKQNGGVLVFLDSSNPQENNIREFGIGAQILKELGVNQIRLITSQSKEIGFIGIHGFSLDVVEEIAI